MRLGAVLVSSWTLSCSFHFPGTDTCTQRALLNARVVKGEHARCVVGCQVALKRHVSSSEAALKRTSKCTASVAAYHAAYVGSPATSCSRSPQMRHKRPGVRSQQQHRKPAIQCQASTSEQPVADKGFISMIKQFLQDQFLPVGLLVAMLIGWATASVLCCTCVASCLV